MMKNNMICNCGNNSRGSYIFYTNAALLFTRIYGKYSADSREYTFSSGTLVLGETFTVNLPDNANNIEITIDTSAYFSWTTCYHIDGIILPNPLCLYTIGEIFHVACFDSPCNEDIINSLLCRVKKILEIYPIDMGGIDKLKLKIDSYPLAYNYISGDNNPNSNNRENCQCQNIDFENQINEYRAIMQDLYCQRLN